MNEQIQFEQIIKYLIDNTVNGNAIWSLSNSIFNSDVCHKLETKSDKDTTFKIEITISESTGLQQFGSALYIHNKNILGSMKGIHQSDFPKVRELEKVLFDMYVKYMIKPRSNEVYTSILNSLGLEKIRDDKLEKILDHPKKTFFEKIFKK